jgi:hypothetical protein
MATQSSKQPLIQDLDAARSHLAGCVTALRHDLDVPARLKAGIASHPGIWFAVAAAFGLALSQIPLGRRKVKVKGPVIRNSKAETAGKSAFAIAALKFGLDFAKPAMMKWFKENVLDRSSSQTRRRS